MTETVKDATAMEPLKQNPNFTISLGDHNQKPKMSVQPSPSPSPGLGAALSSSSPADVRSTVMKEQKQCKLEEALKDFRTRKHRMYEQRRIRDRDRAVPYFRERRQDRPERFCWTFERHKRLVDAVDLLGGIEKASAEKVFAIMKPREESIRFGDVFTHLFKLRMMLRMERWFDSALQLPVPVSRSSPSVSESGTFSSLLDDLKDMRLEPKDS